MRTRASHACVPRPRAIAGAVVVCLAALGFASPPAGAVLKVQASGRTISYMPLRGARPAPNAPDEAFGNLEYNGGAVMPENTNYLVFWEPAGAPAYPAKYKSGLERYFEDLAHDSGKNTNVDSVATQYNDTSGQFAAYSSHFAGSLIDTAPYPERQCSEGKVCVTEAQIEEVLSTLVAERSLASDLTHEYFLVPPPGVEVCYTAASTECSANTKHPAFCAFHGDIHAAGGPLVYAVDPYVTGNKGCDDGKHPNASPSDGALQGGLSHEHVESVTDPEPHGGWSNFAFNREIGDQCRLVVSHEAEFGTPLGISNGAPYNQEINGDKYWYQTEWSNQTKGCLQRLQPAALPTASFTASQSGGTSIEFDASSSTPGVIYDWRFGDGSPPLEGVFPKPTHVFPGAGSYTVSLTVYTADGSSAGTASPVTVSELPQAEPGWEVKAFATDFLSTRLGPMGIVADAGGNVYVDDAPAGQLYRFGPTGGSAEAAGAQLGSGIGRWPVGLAFGKDGELYAVLDEENRVVQVDPLTGAVHRTVAEIPVPLGISTDPVSGDLFVTSVGNASVERISNPSSSSPGVSTYASGLANPDGISAAPDGTFYIEDGGSIDRIAGTAAANAGEVSTISFVEGADGVAVGANPFNPAAPSFIVANSNNGFMDRVDLANPQFPQAVFTGGTRGDFVTVAPDGCLYATQVATVIRVSGPGGSCPFAPISPYQPPEAQPALPHAVSANSIELTATLNAHGAATTFHFEFGTSTAYGQSTGEASAGAGNAPIVVAQTVGGLLAATTYHYRVVAHNQGGTIVGPDTAVTTASQGVLGERLVSAPTALALPAIRGRAVRGQTLTCYLGSWSNASSLVPAWLRDGSAIAGGGAYKLTAADVGHRVACAVTATGLGGTTRISSPAVRVAASSAPFTIVLRARRASAAALRHGVAVTVIVPRGCTLTLRLLALQPGRHGVQARLLATRLLRFAHAGKRTTRLTASARRGEIVRVAATARSGSLRSAPSAITIVG
jgi:PKD repeat protein